MGTRAGPISSLRCETLSGAAAAARLSARVGPRPGRVPRAAEHVCARAAVSARGSLRTWRQVCSRRGQGRASWRRERGAGARPRARARARAPVRRRANAGVLGRRSASPPGSSRPGSSVTEFQLQPPLPNGPHSLIFFLIHIPCDRCPLSSPPLIPTLWPLLLKFSKRSSFRCYDCSAPIVPKTGFGRRAAA